MRPQLVLLLATLIMSTSGIALAQSKKDDPNTLVARLSYNSTYAKDWAEPGSRRVCFALYGGGYYQLSRLTQEGTETLQGTLSSGQFSHLTAMIKNFDSQFTGGGVIREGSEWLLVDEVDNGKTVRHKWIDPDRQHPFPNSAIAIVDWLQNFKAKGASPLTLRELGEQPICPPATAKPLQPVVASLHAGRASGFCAEQLP